LRYGRRRRRRGGALRGRDLPHVFALCREETLEGNASRHEHNGRRRREEVIAQIQGKGVYSKLKYESGVHRVQRVPATEASGRIHTSTVTVAMLPEADDVDVQIEQKDLRIDTYCSSGPAVRA